MKGRLSSTHRLASTLKPSRLNAALLAALMLPVGTAVYAQDQDEDAGKAKAEQLDRITVTG